MPENISSERNIDSLRFEVLTRFLKDVCTEAQRIKSLCHRKQPTVSCFRWFFRCQCFAMAFVACESHSESAARSAIAAAAKYFGAFAAGLPRGTRSFAEISGAISFLKTQQERCLSSIKTPR
jgi:hypothetical protein